jgi:hypothetical protein
LKFCIEKPERPPDGLLTAVLKVFTPCRPHLIESPGVRVNPKTVLILRGFCRGIESRVRAAKTAF